jgi:hypothetical protein
MASVHIGHHQNSFRNKIPNAVRATMGTHIALNLSATLMSRAEIETIEVSIRQQES